MRCGRILLGLVVLLLTGFAAAAQLQGIRTWTQRGTTRVVFDLSHSVPYRVFTLEQPDRLVIDFDNTKINQDIKGLDLKEALFRRVRWGIRDGRHARLVIDLAQPVAYSQFPMGAAAGGKGSRVVVDLQRAGPEARQLAIDHPAQKRDPINDILLQQAANARRQAETPVVPDIAEHQEANARAGKGRSVIVVIDPGHGGKDPGATGVGGVHEKNVVLAIARRLKATLDATPGFQAVLTRDSDIFLPLRDRSAFARRHHADLFISIHADAARSKTSRGSSVFALSQHGATSETARWLAQSENSADLIGGVGGDLSLENKDEMLRGVLLDLSMTATVNAALSVGNDVIKQIGSVNALHRGRVEQAGFVVLKSPDIPSLLIETGFVTTPAEAHLLQTPAHQQKLATAIASGVQRYFHRHPPPGTSLAPSVPFASNKRVPNRLVPNGMVPKKMPAPAASPPAPAAPPTAKAVGGRHRVSAGETLGGIARAYRTDSATLKRLNHLKRDQINVGQVLKLP